MERPETLDDMSMQRQDDQVLDFEIPQRKIHARHIKTPRLLTLAKKRPV